jgi:GH15 family glucan-1,4-alpha-glucosidase
VRIGNAASKQLQLDVYGEVADALELARRAGMDPDAEAWNMQMAMLEWLESRWRTPDDGVWEARSGPKRHIYSQVMAWVAFDRAANTIERSGLEGDSARWRSVADEIHVEVCASGVDRRGVFTQSFGSSVLDASALMIPIVGFLPPDDRRVVATIEAILDELTVDGFVRRYSTSEVDDGVGGQEGAFLLCSFWMVDALALSGRHREATRLFERLLDVRNDVGLLAEEYDPSSGHHLGNFPQAFSHIGLVNSAAALCEVNEGASQMRSTRPEPSGRL